MLTPNNASPPSCGCTQLAFIVCNNIAFLRISYKSIISCQCARRYIALLVAWAICNSPSLGCFYCSRSNTKHLSHVHLAQEDTWVVCNGPALGGIYHSRSGTN
eukprot:1147064-Pelagomonas_calceolata.AAC.1